MSVYVLTPLAKADIFDIWSYIADDNEDAADSVERAIYDACAFVAEARPFPARSHNPFAPFPDTDPLSELFRCVPARDGPLEIVAVMHGKRNIRRVLKQRQ
jgi:plasmid stabilization system protein ParE